MTPGYSLVQGSLSNLSGPYFLHATAKRLEIETISYQRSTWESQTQLRWSAILQRRAETNSLPVQTMQDTDNVENEQTVIVSSTTHCLLLANYLQIFVKCIDWLECESTPALQQKANRQHGYFCFKRRQNRRSNQVNQYIFTNQKGSFTYSHTQAIKKSWFKGPCGLFFFLHSHRFKGPVCRI